MFRICFNLKINYSSILKLTLLVKYTFCGEVSKSAVLASAPDIKQMKKISIYKQEIEKRSSSILTWWTFSIYAYDKHLQKVKPAFSDEVALIPRFKFFNYLSLNVALQIS